MVNGLSGQRMLIGLAIGIICLIFMVLKTKIQRCSTSHLRTEKHLVSSTRSHRALAAHWEASVSSSASAL